MAQWIRAHFDGRNIVPDEPVEFSPGQRLSVQISEAPGDGHRANGAAPLNPHEIQEQLRKLESIRGVLEGPAIPLEELRRENLYEGRA